MNTGQLKQLENDLWSAADNLRANTGLKSAEYATPVLGLIFLKFADNKYRLAEKEIEKEFKKLSGTRREKPLSEIAIEKCGFYLPDHSRYDYLLNLPEQEDAAKKIKQAMEAIEKYKPELEGSLPKDEYAPLTRTDKTIPAQLLKTFSNIPRDAGGDVLGKIYEFFLGKFALGEGQKGGEFFTPTSVVRLMVEIIEPRRGTLRDPACGSGGMFVQSRRFAERHGNASDKPGETGGRLYVYGQEKVLDTVKLAKMNLVVNGLRGEIKQANSYSEDPFNGFGKFDYVMANPPFNVDDVPLATVEKDPRFNTYGVPRKKNKSKKKRARQGNRSQRNYLWINLFAASLNEKGRAALVMANSASDARHSEADIRRKLIEENLIHGALTLPSNMFYTVTLPATLWFFDKDKPDDKILFIDARNIFTQIDRAHREFSEEQIQNIAVVNRLRKGNRAAFIRLIDGYFEKGTIALIENERRAEAVAEHLKEVLENEQGEAAAENLLTQWKGLKKLKESHQNYLDKADKELKTAADLNKRNKAQHKLRESFDPFFSSLRDGLKQLDKIIREHDKNKAEEARRAGKLRAGAANRETKKLRQALEELDKKTRNAESYLKHIQWLQERFPKAEYEDVTGLCKLATPKDVEEQDYSLNPGRYVGVVIEEDGKTEEAFLGSIDNLHNEYLELSAQAKNIHKVICSNLKELLDGQ